MMGSYVLTIHMYLGTQYPPNALTLLTHLKATTYIWYLHSYVGNVCGSRRVYSIGYQGSTYLGKTQLWFIHNGVEVRFQCMVCIMGARSSFQNPSSIDMMVYGDQAFSIWANFIGAFVFDTTYLLSAPPIWPLFPP
jgi:hypothetical protein